MTDLNPEDLRLFLINNTLFALVFLALAVIITWVAYIRGFYSLPYKDFKGPKILAYDVFAAFAIFLVVYLLVPTSVWWIFSSWIERNHPLFISLLQLAIFGATVLLLALYSLFRDHKTMARIWKDKDFPASKGLFSDLTNAWLTLIVSAPIILTIAHLSEVLRVALFGYSAAEQLAIRYLKLALQSPIGAILAFVAILILAPCLEEYLFRGFLQSWLRRKIGPVKAIFVSATLFGLFHFSTAQASTNLPLIITLIVFALYLGFLYEKTRSLFAPIFLHVTFNCISVIRIIFTEV